MWPSRHVLNGRPFKLNCFIEIEFIYLTDLLSDLLFVKKTRISLPYQRQLYRFRIWSPFHSVSGSTTVYTLHTCIPLIFNNHFHFSNLPLHRRDTPSGKYHKLHVVNSKNNKNSSNARYSSLFQMFEHYVHTHYSNVIADKLSWISFTDNLYIYTSWVLLFIWHMLWSVGKWFHYVSHLR